MNVPEAGSKQAVEGSILSVGEGWRPAGEGWRRVGEGWRPAVVGWPRAVVDWDLEATRKQQ